MLRCVAPFSTLRILSLGLLLLAALTVGPAWAEPPPEPAADAKAKTGIEFKITPDTAIIHVDGKEIGKAKDVKFHPLKPGTHTVRLVNDGDETEAELVLQKGQVLMYTYSFE